jgi:acetyltransferase-like isoleucine patch superfamily enzyme
MNPIMKAIAYVVSVPAYLIVAGNPARVIKKYNLKTRQWEKVI